MPRASSRTGANRTFVHQRRYFSEYRQSGSSLRQMTGRNANLSTSRLWWAGDTGGIYDQDPVFQGRRAFGSRPCARPCRYSRRRRGAEPRWPTRRTPADACRAAADAYGKPSPASAGAAGPAAAAAAGRTPRTRPASPRSRRLWRRRDASGRACRRTRCAACDHATRGSPCTARRTGRSSQRTPRRHHRSSQRAPGRPDRRARGSPCRCGRAAR